MEDPGQTAVQTLSHWSDPASVARGRDPRMSTAGVSCCGLGLEHRSPGPIDVIAALAEQFLWPAPEPRCAAPELQNPVHTREFVELRYLHLHEKMG